MVMAGFCKYVDKVLGRTVECRAQARAAHTQCVTSSSSSSLRTPTCNHSRPPVWAHVSCFLSEGREGVQKICYLCVFIWWWVLESGEDIVLLLHDCLFCLSFHPSYFLLPLPPGLVRSECTTALHQHNIFSTSTTTTSPPLSLSYCQGCQCGVPRCLGVSQYFSRPTEL